MSRLLQSYLQYARGEVPGSAWALLRPLSWLTGKLSSARDWMYRHGVKRSMEAPLPVISVGNLTTGGTNKTPFVEYLAKHMVRQGLVCGVVSRGYGGVSRTPLVFRNGRAKRSAVGDEPLLLSNKLKEVVVAVSPDRFVGTEYLARCGCDVAVADDCFQHRRLDRDCDIVLVDATCPFGNGQLLPGGILREKISAISRAHLIVLSKVDQVTDGQLMEIERKLAQYVPLSRVFRSRLRIAQWGNFESGRLAPSDFYPKDKKLAAFSAIGNPHSFLMTLQQAGVRVISSAQFKDHHRFTPSDLNRIAANALRAGACGLTCTEKDTYNLPSGWKPPLPLWVPQVETALEDEDRFWSYLTDCLKPQLVVASNGHGEDAIGAVVAKKLKARLPDAQVVAFPVVGMGSSYRAAGISVVPPPAVTPSGGVVKYRFRDLIGDIRAGLFGHIRAQISCWRKLRYALRTPVCVGDSYMLLHTLWGQGRSPLFVATAKTVHISGHMKIERWLYRRNTRMIWTRDDATRQELAENGGSVRFAGNPIMDLAEQVPSMPSLWENGRRILVLPGSRDRAYRDLPLLLDALELVARKAPVSAVLVVASTISTQRLVRAASGWHFDETGSVPSLRKNGLTVKVFSGEVSQAARGAEVLLGLAGTANQICAGLGIPVVSVDEKGKRVQKKLLAGSEILVPKSPVALSDVVLGLLDDPQSMEKMAQIGRSRLGSSGMADDLVNWAAEHLGWERRCRVWRSLQEKREETAKDVGENQ